MKYSSILLVVMLLLFACRRTHVEKSVSKNESSTIIDSELTIVFDANECGEWGGHHERMKVDLEQLSFEKSKIVCDSLVKDFKPGDSTVWAMIPYEHMVYSKKVKLSRQEKEIISEFIILSLKSRLIEENDYELGYSQGLSSRVKIFNVDGTLKITCSNKTAIEEYHKLVRRLELFEEHLN